MPTPRMVTSHQHVQTVAAEVWSISHGLHCNPVVGCKVVDNGELVGVIPAKVHYVSTTLVEITFSSPRTGEARLS